MFAPVQVLPWPDALAGTPVTVVLELALGRGRLAHSLMLTGDDLEVLRGAGLTLADRLLNPPETAPERRRSLNSGSHPDCFHLRPAGKSRQIGAEATRELIGKVQVSAATGLHKVAILHECDRMNTVASNIFLKTLEEPPAHTTLLLLTTRPHALLPTIRSRCQLFRFVTPSAATPLDGWAAWLEDYRAWLALLQGGAAKTAPADAMFRLYGLVSRFGVLLETATEALWAVQKKTLPEELTEEEAQAIETGISKGLRDRLLADLERATGEYAREVLVTPAAASGARAFVETVRHLERSAGLLRVNFNDTAALELFMLQTLRAWTRR